MISVLIRTILMYLLLNLMMKVMGKRQIGELEANELVAALLISEIASIPINDSDISFLPSLLPILIISALEVIVSVMKNKLPSVKRAVEGEPEYLIYDGRLRQSALRENRISVNELLSEMRSQGIGDIKDVAYGVLEQNGKISFLTKLNAPAEAVVVDTEIDRRSMREAAVNEERIQEELRSRGLTLEDVFLMSVSNDGSVYIICKEEKK